MHGLTWFKVSRAPRAELLSQFDGHCSVLQDSATATDAATSRFVHEWIVGEHEGEIDTAVRLGSRLRGVIDIEAFDVEIWSGTARQANQSNLRSSAAREKAGFVAALDVDDNQGSDNWVPAHVDESNTMGTEETLDKHVQRAWKNLWPARTQ